MNDKANVDPFNRFCLGMDHRDGPHFHRHFPIREGKPMKQTYIRERLSNMMGMVTDGAEALSMRQLDLETVVGFAAMLSGYYYELESLIPYARPPLANRAIDLQSQLNNVIQVCEEFLSNTHATD